MSEYEKDSAADMAAYLADDLDAADRVESELERNQVVRTLVRLRLRKNLTQKEVAEQMGCGASKVSKLESGNDESLKWGDIVCYAEAVGARMNLLISDEEWPAAQRIKQHVFRIHELLEELKELARTVQHDQDIISRIDEFYGQVLLNFLLRFGDSYSSLKALVPTSTAAQRLREDSSASETATEEERSPANP
jgi:transcriptional regulator with XRE-family HTH domain